MAKNKKPGKMVPKEDSKKKESKKKADVVVSETKKFPRCADTHPALDLGGVSIWGGNCWEPIVEADVYIALQEKRPSAANWPWVTDKVEVLYPIADRCPPRNPDSFRDMVNWTLEQLDAGKRVHVGCIGGHGRTGMLLSALVASLGLVDDPIQYVRDNYCERAVESADQIKFLVDEYGCKKVKPVPPRYTTVKKGSKWGGSVTPLFDGVSERDDPFTDPINDLDSVLDDANDLVDEGTSSGDGTGETRGGVSSRSSNYNDWLKSYKKMHKWP